MSDDRLDDAAANMAVESQYLVERIGRILHGRDPAVQSAALADLLAMWLAGHVVPGDPAETDRLRSDLLRDHVRLVADLVRPNAERINALSRKE
jgi:hypothetical protein